MVEEAGGSSAEAELSVVVELGADAETVPIVLRALRSQEDYAACEELERDTWGQDFSECVPAGVLMITQKVGGVAAGAFDSDGRMVGMVYGLTGPRGGELAHWSHMLAVRPEYRGVGLGRELKLYQRRVVIEKGASVMLWTYDPLVARNAYLNICKLGARPVEYVRDLYGPDTASELHTGLGTDRFVVAWRLDGEADSACEVEDPAWAEAPVLNVTPEGEPTEDQELPEAERVKIEIPADVQVEKAADAEAGGRWRASTRLAIERSLEAGLVVQGFERDAASGRGRYRLGRTGRGRRLARQVSE